jgi:phosphonate transport system ATP-binding protein
MLLLDHVTKRFGDVTAVDRAKLDIPDGEMIGIIGRSGAGKSTLLRMINRLVDPSEGRIVHGASDVGALQGRALHQWRASCAMIFQQFNLVKRLDVITNVLVGRLAYRPLLSSLLMRFTPAERALAVRCLERVDIAELALQPADTLSGGQQQRVAIARALCQQPRIILADEPIASLDPRSARIVMDTLARINRADGITVVVNLHDLDAAKAYCRRIVGMRGGAVVFDGPPERLTPAAISAIYGADFDPEKGEDGFSRLIPAAAVPSKDAAVQPLVH